MTLLIKNIKELINVETARDGKFKNKVCGKEMSKLATIKDAYLYIEGDKIADFGQIAKFDNSKFKIQNSKFKTIDATDRMVFPSFCDSHTHIVYAGSRENEFIDRIKGLTYKEIALRGGGILNSVKLLRNTSEDELYKQTLKRIEEIIYFGTGAVEIKSGYGLNLEDELKMLRVIKRLKETSSLTIKATFLGAHAVPQEFNKNNKRYIDTIIQEMLPRVAEEKLADFIDVFCDKGFFTVKDTDKILSAGAKYGLIPKIHANELANSGGVQIGVKHNALSVDHLEYTGDAEIQTLHNSHTMPTILPSTAFFLGLKYAPARKMIDAGLPVALASDYNPGSSPSGNMQLVMSLACIKLKMLPEEVINATTINSAYAMGVSTKLGTIAKGKIANVFITKEIPSYAFLPYSFGNNLVQTVILNGKIYQRQT